MLSISPTDNYSKSVAITWIGYTGNEMNNVKRLCQNIMPKGFYEFSQKMAYKAGVIPFICYETTFATDYVESGAASISNMVRSWDMAEFGKLIHRATMAAIKFELPQPKIHTQISTRNLRP